MAKRNENARIRTRKLAVAAMLCALGVVLLYVGSVIEGAEAVEYGLIDAVGGIDAALADLKRQIKQKKRKK